VGAGAQGLFDEKEEGAVLETGCVARSLAGRDKGALLLVTAANEAGVWVCNGGARPLERPKRKNPRHLADTGRRLEKPPGNRALRRALRALGAPNT
jgi:ribosomal protein L14E/L6E/L27E